MKDLLSLLGRNTAIKQVTESTLDITRRDIQDNLSG